MPVKQRPAEWLSPEDLAEELRLPIQTIYYWNKQGTAPKRVPFGKHVRYRRCDVDEWLAEKLRAALTADASMADA